jgi:hypothetical protein
LFAVTSALNTNTSIVITLFFANLLHSQYRWSLVLCCTAVVLQKHCSAIPIPRLTLPPRLELPVLAIAQIAT